MFLERGAISHAQHDKSLHDLIQKMGIAIGDHITQMMDVDHAHKQFTMRLEEWLKADDFNFAHDFCGIQTLPLPNET